MFTEYSEEYTQSNFGSLDFLQIKSPFYNKGDVHYVYNLSVRCHPGDVTAGYFSPYWTQCTVTLNSNVTVLKI